MGGQVEKRLGLALAAGNLASLLHGGGERMRRSGRPSGATYETGEIDGSLLFATARRVLPSQDCRVSGECILHGRINFIAQDYGLRVISR